MSDNNIPMMNLAETTTPSVFKSLTPTQKLYRIVTEGLCIGCGLCQSVASPAVIQIRTQPTGYQRPCVVGELSESIVDVIYQVCPGINVSLEQPPNPAIKEDLLWGDILSAHLAWAVQPEVRFQGSTGGIMTALAQYLVSSNEVDFVLHVKASESEPAFGERHLSFSDADVIEAAGSRYGPAAPLIDFVELLDRGQPFAFMGKPCDISALNNYSRYDDRVDQLVRYRLAIVCGGYLAAASFNEFLESTGVAPQELKSIRYRGNGCPGPVKVENTQGEVFLRSYSQFWGGDDTNWSIPFRCKICPNGIGEGADLSVADSWPGGIVDSVTEQDDLGVNAMVVRSSKGEQLMQRARAANFISLGSEINARDMDFYQPHQVQKRQAAQARIEVLQAEGSLGICCAGLRLGKAAKMRDKSFFIDQKEGTQRRLRAGDAKEPSPL